MALYTDSTKKPINPGDSYVAADGTQYPANFPKSEIPGLIAVTETARPSDESLVVTGFVIDESNTQVWSTRPKTEEELAQEVDAALSVRRGDALTKLTDTDLVALRCVKAGVAFPQEWLDYVNALRAVRSSPTILDLPEPPKNPDGSVAYPAGT